MVEWVYRSTFSSPRHLFEVSGQLPSQPVYPRGNNPRYPLDRRLGGPQNRSGQRGEEKILDPIGTRSPSLFLQPVASRYTDCTIPVPILGHMRTILWKRKNSFTKHRHTNINTANKHNGRNPILRTTVYNANLYFHVGFEVLTPVVIDNIFWDITQSSACHLLSRWFLVRLIFRLWRWRRYVLPKSRLNFNRPHCVMSQHSLHFHLLNAYN
jgi:hypothetical protein